MDGYRESVYRSDKYVLRHTGPQSLLLITRTSVFSRGGFQSLPLYLYDVNLVFPSVAERSLLTAMSMAPYQTRLVIGDPGRASQPCPRQSKSYGGFADLAA